MKRISLILLTCGLSIVFLTAPGSARRNTPIQEPKAPVPEAAGGISKSEPSSISGAPEKSINQQQTATPTGSETFGATQQEPSAPKNPPSTFPKSETRQAQTKQNVVLPSQRHNLSINLRETVYEMPAIDLTNVKTKPNQIGVNRPTDFSIESVGKAYRTADSSQVLVLSVKSPDALGIRVHITDFDIPDGDEVYIYGNEADSEVQGPYTGQGPFKTKEFWSGTVNGDTAVIEYYSRGGSRDFRVSEVAHLYSHPVSSITPDVLSCQVDAACSSAPEKNAVGRIVFQNNGSFVCSGTLLNDKDAATFVPYFLTANHCVSTQTIAQTVETYWFYQTSSCNSGVLRSGIGHSISGTSLLATSQSADSTLIRILGAMPGGLSFSGWDSGAKPTGTTVFGLHHPGGGTPPSTESYLRRSDGSIAVTARGCSATGMSNGYQVDWSSGITEQGSSGSGLWYANGGTNYLIGVDSCGPISVDCNFNGNSFGVYGSFHDFFPLIQTYINTASSGPANDNFASAQTISGSSGNTTGSNSAATKEANEPNHAGNVGGTSVWYLWQAPSSGSVVITTAGSNFDTLLGVYTGSSVGALATIASNDDEDLANGINTSRVTFNATAGTNYRIAVDGYDAATGSISLNWSLSAQTYTISLSASPAGGGSVSGAGTFSAGTSRTVTATANSGYAFSNWTESGSVVSNLASYTFTLNSNRTLVANFTVVSGAPSAPTATAATSITSSSFTANWNSSAGATGYRLDVSLNSSFSTFVSGYQNLDVGNVLSRSVAGLSASTIYYYRLRAYNGNGTSGNSNTITVTTTSPTSPPPAPVANAATNIAGNSFNANWSSSSGATGYRLDISTNNVFTTFVTGYQNLDVGNVLTRSVTGLASNTTYYYRLRAYNGNGTSGNSNTITVATTTGNCTITLSVSPAGSGFVGGAGTYPCGSSRTVSATPASGYTFVNWTEGATIVSTSASYAFTLNSNRTLVAHFNQNTTTNYTIALSVSPAGSGFVSGAGTYAAGSSRTVTASPASGYTFVNWTEGATIVSTSASYAFTLNSNRTLVAHFNQNTTNYTIALSVSPAGSGFVTGAGTYAAGSSRTVSATPASGYTFVNWTEGATIVSTSASYAFTLNSNRTLVAHFNQNTTNYTIALSVSPAGSGFVTGAGTYAAGSSRTVSATPASGYTFVNWTEGATIVSTSASYAFTLNSNRTLVAHFNQNPTTNYTIALSVSPAGSGFVTGNGTFAAGSSRTVSTTPASGYTFVNWTEGATIVSTSASYAFTLNSNRTLVAHFNQNPTTNYTIALSVSPAGSGFVSGAGTYAAGSSRAVSASPASGYTFANWTEGATIVSTSASYTFTLNSNRNLVAHFTPTQINYTISLGVSPAGSGFVTGAGTYAAGSSRTVSATPASGYTFVNWTEGATIVSTSASYAFTLNSNRTLVAHFNQNPTTNYTIALSVSPAGSGFVSGAGTYAAGSSRTVSASPASGYTFANWTEGATIVSTSASYAFTLNSNRNLVANFTPTQINYTISLGVSPAGSGFVTGAGTYAAGSSRTVSATPASGYTFANWTEGATIVSTSASYAFTLNSNRTLVAHFNQNPITNYTIALSVSPAGSGFVTGAGTYAAGSSRTVSATPASGYTFANWTEGATIVSTSASYAFTLNSNRTLVAHFNQNPITNYTIALSVSPAGSGFVSGNGTYAGGSSRTVSTTPASGYTFANWTEGATIVSTSASYAFTLNSNRTLVAHFNQNPITNYTIALSVSPAGSGFVTGAGTYAAGSSRTVSATPASGYTFANWTEGATIVSTSASYNFTLNSNRTLVAHFNQNPITNYTIALSVSPAGSGFVTGNGTFAAGSSRTVSTTPASGYTFVNWTEGATIVSTSASYAFTLNSNRTLVAHFNQNTTNYTIALSVSPAGSGFVSGNGTYAGGSSRTVTASPNSGYTFVNWTEGATIVSTSASYAFTLNSNRNLVAHFNAVNYTITLSVSPVGAGFTSGNGTYAAGSSRTVTASPASGYVFASWKENNVVVSTSPSYNFILSSSRNLVANFTAVGALNTTLATPLVTLASNGSSDAVMGDSSSLNLKSELVTHRPWRLLETNIYSNWLERMFNAVQSFGGPSDSIRYSDRSGRALSCFDSSSFANAPRLNSGPWLTRYDPGVIENEWYLPAEVRRETLPSA